MLGRTWWIGVGALGLLTACTVRSSEDDAGTARDASIDAPRDAPPVDAPRATSLEIEPRDPVVVLRDGASEELALRAFAVWEDGTRTEVGDAVWTLEHGALGPLSDEGVLSLTGVAGGTVRVDATSPSVQAGLAVASTTVEVRLESVVAPVPDGAVAAFDRAPVTDPARAAAVVYPLDRARMPANVAAPEVHWDGSVAGDVLRVSLRRSHASITAYVEHEALGAALLPAPPAAAWRRLSESDRGTPIEVSVDRLEAASGDVIAGAPVEVHLDTAAVYGIVYYYEIAPRGIGPPGYEVPANVMRIRPDGATREPVVPQPPDAPGTRGAGNCMGCHDVSSDGRYLVGNIYLNNGLGVFDLTEDLTALVPPTRFPPIEALVATGFPWDEASLGASSFSPDGTRIALARVIESTPASLRSDLMLIAASTGMRVPAPGLFEGDASSPAWSPDGTRLAYVAGGFDSVASNRATDLVVQPVIAPDTFGDRMVLHRGDDLAGAVEGGEADGRPSWSPDSTLLAFHHGGGNGSMVFDETGTHVRVPAAIYVMPSTGGAPVRLDRAMGGPEMANAFEPAFSPFVGVAPEGGRRFWIVFSSSRRYGHRFSGDDLSHKYLWVTAIDPDAPPGADPSHVPYWLPGQDLVDRSSAFQARWTPLACRTTGETCAGSSDCCSGTCVPDAAEPAVSRCAPTPPDACRARGQTCEHTSDCCADAGLSCTGRVCENAPF